MMEGFPTLALCALAALTLGCGEKDVLDSAPEDSATDDSGSTDDSGATDDSSAADDSGEEALSFATDVAPIISNSCSPCHTSSASGGLDMSANNAYGNLVNGTANSGLTLVTPNDPANSYMWRKLEGTQSEAGGGGDQMPKGNAPLPQDAMGTIDQWIRTGANP
ncbi:MAG: hypothetical protein H6740_04735 [Alphaproteobacteria bacterium]|nr:hypothetical protein [Alphaproteobacteria bacterium]